MSLETEPAGKRQRLVRRAWGAGGGTAPLRASDACRAPQDDGDDASDADYVPEGAGVLSESALQEEARWAAPRTRARSRAE